MEIGKPIRTIQVEPIKNPVPPPIAPQQPKEPVKRP